MTMLDVHEFSGTMTYETNFGLENVDFAYNLYLAEDADPDLIEEAARVLAQFIVTATLDEHPPSSKYHPN